MSQLQFVRTRTSTPGPEENLVRAALEMGMFGSAAVPPVIFREPALPLGFPDVVAVYNSRRTLSRIRSRRSLNALEIQLLHRVCAARRMTFERLAISLNWTVRDVRKVLLGLESIDCIEIREASVAVPSVPALFGTRKIVAVEAKIRNWSKAIDQAVANTWFASHSYILLPKSEVGLKVIAKAKSHGVGVIAATPTRTVTVLKPKIQKIPSSYGSWLFNEWSWHFQ